MVAVYAGSFDPFTNGHMAITKKAAKLFDKVFILLSVNSNKSRTYSTEDSIEAISNAVTEAGLTNVCVEYYDGLVVDFCNTVGAEYLIRGLRTPGDYAYEENVANINKELAYDIETIYLRADSAILSSSMVRELVSYGRAVDNYVPKAILRMIVKYVRAQYDT